MAEVFWLLTLKTEWFIWEVPIVLNGMFLHNRTLEQTGHFQSNGDTDSMPILRLMGLKGTLKPWVFTISGPRNLLMIRVHKNEIANTHVFSSKYMMYVKILSLSPNIYEARAMYRDTSCIGSSFSWPSFHGFGGRSPVWRPRLRSLAWLWHCFWWWSLAISSTVSRSLRSTHDIFMNSWAPDWRLYSPIWCFGRWILWLSIYWE